MDALRDWCRTLAFRQGSIDAADQRLYDAALAATPARHNRSENSTVVTPPAEPQHMKQSANGCVTVNREQLVDIIEQAIFETDTGLEAALLAAERIEAAEPTASPLDVEVGTLLVRAQRALGIAYIDQRTEASAAESLAAAQAIEQLLARRYDAAEPTASPGEDR